MPVPESLRTGSSVQGMTIDQSRRARAARRRRKRYLAADNDLTREQWLAIRLAWDEQCAYCGDPAGSLQRDCVLPLSRGGRYTIENVVPACRSCNASKSNQEVTRWMRMKRLNEPRFLQRFAEICLVLR